MQLRFKEGVDVLAVDPVERDAYNHAAAVDGGIDDDGGNDWSDEEGDLDLEHDLRGGGEGRRDGTSEHLLYGRPLSAQLAP